MPDRFINFMVPVTGPTLIETIKSLRKSSSDFCLSLGKDKETSAATISQEAFGFLDHIGNELLRCRDSVPKTEWVGSPLVAALDAVVGTLIEPTTTKIEEDFYSQGIGCGAMPDGAPISQLKLAVALNKLKHRSSNTRSVNFRVSNGSAHELYIFTIGVGRKNNSISSFDVQALCCACLVAANAV